FHSGSLPYRVVTGFRARMEVKTMPAIATPPGIAENRVLLHNISWGTYERLLRESTENCGTRFTFDGGNLEIMVVSIGHENPTGMLALMVQIAALEIGRDFFIAGSTTFK